MAICILVFLIGESNYYYNYASSLIQEQQKFRGGNLMIIVADNVNIFGSLAKRFSNIAKQLEYTVDLSGKQIFSNDTLKDNIVTYYKSSTYNISTLKYRLLGFDVTTSDIKIEVKPSRIDATKTKIDLPLVVARDVSVTNGILNLKYSEINLSSIYGIYDKTSDEMTLHIPFNIALQYLPSSL
jgi:hypothetical protein